MNRRDAIKGGAMAAAGMLMMSEALAQQARQTGALRVLILGGTGFIGPHFVTALREGGHKVTVFNRGRRKASLPADVEALEGDRDGKLDALKRRDWDVVIDNSGYVPRVVKQSVDLLKDRVQHYIFISSISAYADLSTPGIGEDYKLAALKDPTTEDIGENYGGLKVLCEQVVEQVYGKRSAIVRPTYIVGPGDTTDRFTYWPVRAAKGGEMLVPGTPKDPLQFIDVRDLADFMRLCAEQRFPGVYNACNPPGAVTMGDVLDTTLRITGAKTKFVWASPEFLEKQKMIDGGEIPIWAPTTGELAGVALVNPARAVSKGLRFRTLETTVRDTLAWHAKRPAAEQQKLRAGLTAEREKELLKQLRGGAA